MSNGTLYICATPIGNLEDITLRVLRVLAEVDLIAAEDTRHTLKLLNHYEIKTPLTSYHENNKNSKGGFLIQKLMDGANVALVSDSGMPAISDPGRDLVQLCYENEIAVTVCPGASAGLSALVLSGFKAQPHVFEGFLPRGDGDKREVLQLLAAERRTMIFYEAPHRLVETLKYMRQILGDRQIAVVREITKKYEEVKHGSISKMEQIFTDTPPKGEFVIVVENSTQIQKNEFPQDLNEHMQIYISQGFNEKQAMKMVASDRGIGKSAIYNELKR